MEGGSGEDEAKGKEADEHSGKGRRKGRKDALAEKRVGKKGGGKSVDRGKMEGCR